MNNLLNLAKQVKSLAEAGLVYNEENYDAERYEELRHIALQMISTLGNTPIKALTDFFLPETDYPTPKVDVRGVVLNEKSELLLVRETVDGGWTLPGGWADIGMTPAEVVVKEMEEESGLIVAPKYICAVFDKREYDHPPQPHYVYKIFFFCERLSGKFDPNFDIDGAGYFSIDALPPLSTDRITKEQLIKIYSRVMDGSREALFDGVKK